MRQTDIRITGASTLIVASASFGGDGRLMTLSMPTVRFGATDDFALAFTRSATGVDIELHGHSVDGTRLAQRGSGNTGAAATGPPGGDLADSTFDEPFHIGAKLDRLVLRDGVSIAPFALDVSGVASRPVSMSLMGSLPHGATIAGTVVPVAGARRLTLSSSDAGTLARGLFGLASMHGGKIDLVANLPGRADGPPSSDPAAPDYQGTMTVRNFTLTNQPFVARLLTAGIVRGCRHATGRAGHRRR